MMSGNSSARTRVPVSKFVISLDKHIFQEVTSRRLFLHFSVINRANLAVIDLPNARRPKMRSPNIDAEVSFQTFGPETA